MRVVKTSIDDEEEFMLPTATAKTLGFFSQTFQYEKVQIFLDEPIREPSYYRHILQKIHSLQEGDALEIIINTPGGQLNGCISLVNALRFCQAEVTGIIDNQAASAGSIIALSCQNIIVAPNSTMMIHNYSSASFGKGNELVTHVNYNDRQIKKLMSEVYEGFLTKEEIEMLFIGKDYYFDSEEIEKRLTDRMQHLQKQQKAKQKQEKLLAKSAGKPKQDLFPTS